MQPSTPTTDPQTPGAARRAALAHVRRRVAAGAVALFLGVSGVLYAGHAGGSATPGTTTTTGSSPSSAAQQAVAQAPAASPVATTTS